MQTPEMHVKILYNTQDLLVNSPEAFEKKLVARINQETIKGSNFLLGCLQAATPVGATGNLRRSWHISTYIIPETGLARSSISNNALYLMPVDQGRRASPISKEGRKSLETWVRRKLGVPENQVKNVAYLIARKKAKEDTPGQNFIKTTMEKNLPFVRGMIQHNIIQAVREMTR